MRKKLSLLLVILTSTYFTLFESNFVDVALDNYDQVETANLKASLFMVASNTILIKHEIFDPEKKTTKVAVLKLWLVYYVSSMQLDKFFSLN